MTKWLFIALFIYLIYKLIKGPNRSQQRQKPFFTFQFGRFPDGQSRKNSDQSTKSRDLDHIEEAEYEDITEEKES